MNLSAIDLNLLHVLCVVLETKSVATAAQRLHVTPSAVSNGLARLRSALKDPLLVKKGRGLTPTPRALALRPMLSQTFDELGTALERTGTFDPQTCTREFAIALSDADQIASLPAIAKGFARSLPQATLRVISLDTFVAEGGLSAETIDATIGPKTAEPDTHAAPLYVDQGIIVARQNHPRIRRHTISAAQFNSERHVDLHLVMGRGGQGHRTVEDALRRAGLTRDVVITAPTFFAAAALVAQTDCLTGMPLRVANALKRTFRLQVLEGPSAPLRFDMYLRWHERTHRDAASAAFREVIFRAFEPTGR